MSHLLPCYETTFILSPEVTDDQKNTFLEKIKTIIKSHDGNVLSVEDWGRRRLAYPIRKESKGLYTYIVFTGNNALVAEIERNYRINEQVMRFLTVKLMDDFDAAKTKLRPTPNVALAPGAVPTAAAPAPQATA